LALPLALKAVNPNEVYLFKNGGAICNELWRYKKLTDASKMYVLSDQVRSLLIMISIF